MKFVGCSGFPVPVSRYWPEFPAVEISETENGLPGAGTVRRWLREAPSGYGFSVLAPKSITMSEFNVSQENQGLIHGVSALSKTISAKAVVFAAPVDWKPNRPRKQAIRNFAASLPTKGGAFVLDAPAWDTDELSALTKDTPLHVAIDPMRIDNVKLDPKKHKALTYFRLPGPAGYRSRYDDAALEKVADAIVQAQAHVVFCTFANIDMFPNAKRTIQLLKASVKKGSKAGAG